MHSPASAPRPLRPPPPDPSSSPSLTRLTSRASLTSQLTTPKYFPDPNAPEKGKDPYALAEGNNPPFKRGAF